MASNGGRTAIRRTVAGAGATAGAHPADPTSTLANSVSRKVHPGLVIVIATLPQVPHVRQIARSAPAPSSWRSPGLGSRTSPRTGRHGLPPGTPVARGLGRPAIVRRRNDPHDPALPVGNGESRDELLATRKPTPRARRAVCPQGARRRTRLATRLSGSRR